MTKKKDTFITDISDDSELSEIRKIAGMLNPDEKVLVVAKQARFKPGGSHFTPNVVYATDRRIILRDPSMLGLKQEVIDIPYNVITNARMEKGVFSASVIFSAPGLFNPNISGRIPWIKNLGTNEHGENGIIDAIPKKKAEELIEIIRNGITQIRTTLFESRDSGINRNDMETVTGNDVVIDRSSSSHFLSPVDELSKLADLKEKGIISDEEFHKMKEKIIGN